MAGLLVLGTGNRKKGMELSRLLAGAGLDLRTLADYPQALDVVEDGDTFRANAALKATQQAAHLREWVLADDSGLEVDALEGKPGVFSARWAQLNSFGAGDADNNKTLLHQLRDVPDEKRSARFVCVLALSDPRGRIILTATDAVEGKILRGPRGANGFGYDPLFYVEALGRTTAELTSEQKHEISHRGKALRELRKKMATVEFE